ncbi:MAG: T9SS type A sorting domain-containing protein, partial [Saprospiraceae bacterium]|nr:T9SS type A sorting domain-containing protein [Saprospiraceae bacterium]
IFITGGTKGVWFADGLRPLSTDDKPVVQNGNILPNPVADFFKIQLEGEQDIQTIRLVNSIGQLVRILPVAQLNTGWNISDLPAGLYTVTLHDQQNKHFASLRLVKK